MTKLNRQMGIALSDIHFPFCDPYVVRLAVEFVREHRPGMIHLLGDIHDFYQISRFNRDPSRKHELQKDLDKVKGFLKELREASPGAKIIYSAGNHEDRLRRYLWSEAEELASLRCLKLEELLDFRRLRIQYRGPEEPYRVGYLLYTHGQMVRKWSGWSAKAHWEKYGCCVLHGHTHRLGSFYHREINDTYGAWENGCLCTLNPEYDIAPDWQHAWSVIWTSRNYFHVEPVAVVKGRYNYHGKMYGRRHLSKTAIFQLDEIH